MKNAHPINDEAGAPGTGALIVAHDARPVEYGTYFLDPTDRPKVLELLRGEVAR